MRRSARTLDHGERISPRGRDRSGPGRRREDALGDEFHPGRAPDPRRDGYRTRAASGRRAAERRGGRCRIPRPQPLLAHAPRRCFRAARSRTRRARSHLGGSPGREARDPRAHGGPHRPPGRARAAPEAPAARRDGPREARREARQCGFRQERAARGGRQGPGAPGGAARRDRPAGRADRAREQIAGLMSGSAAGAAIGAILAQINRVILGKGEQIRLCLACLLARGHLLIEDIPGVGKTTLAHALARTLGLSFQRVQFTSDLLPADVLGVSIFDRETGKFRFQRGPIFAQLVLADEINRASPKAQSALLEAMEEHQVTLDGQTMALPEPFFVIATQNPQDQVGTYPLPESQLDRFLMRVHLGYPAAAAERELLSGVDRRDLVNALSTVATVDSLRRLQQSVLEVHVAPALLDYVQALVAHTRHAPGLNAGLSPRAAIGLLRAARAWALIAGRDAVIPEHVQAVFAAVVEHRVRQRDSGPASVTRLLEAVPIP